MIVLLTSGLLVPEPARPRTSEEVLRLEDSGDIEADLRDLARRQLTKVMQPRLLQLRRLVRRVVIGEAGRFPELGRTFYDQGPGRTIAAPAMTFDQLATRGILQLDDPLLAAQHYNWLIMSIPLNQAMLLGDDQPPRPPTSTATPNTACASSSPPTASANAPS
jgi:TetR/AcrR family transcriptional repressor of mexJK operon